MRTVALLAPLMLCGCLDRIIIDGTLSSTRTASKVFDTLSDLEVAKEGAGSSIVQVEGMMALAPDNEDGLFILTQSWTGYASAFIEDSWEAAVDAEDDGLEIWHATRAKNAYDRAKDNIDVQVDYAEALALASPARRLDGEARALLDAAVKTDPNHQRGLWLLGIAEYQQQRYAQAVERWEHLRSQLPPESDAYRATS